MDVVRLIGGGMVRSVRAMTGIWDPARRVEGAWAWYLEFEDGTPATVVYNGYGHFDTAEFFWWIGEGGTPRDPELNIRTRSELAGSDDETLLKESMRYGGSNQGRAAHIENRPVEPHQPFFGLTIASCEHGDIRQSPDGLYIYGDREKREVPVPLAARGRAAEIQELYDAVVENRPVFHDGRWGEATLEVVLAIMESARQGKEMFMSHQIPSPE